jgi:NAD(P)-dependent dehydrogenase (short-subunit alcohol dehydrogenase family)
MSSNLARAMHARSDSSAHSPLHKTLFDPSGKVELITGSTCGMGRATALAFAGAGADLVVTSHDGRACAEIPDQITAPGRQALRQAADVGSWASVDQLVDAAYAEFDRIDISVNCAGLVIPGDDLKRFRSYV